MLQKHHNFSAIIFMHIHTKSFMQKFIIIFQEFYFFLYQIQHNIFLYLLYELNIHHCCMSILYPTISTRRILLKYIYNLHWINSMDALMNTLEYTLAMFCMIYYAAYFVWWMDENSLFCRNKMFLRVHVIHKNVILFKFVSFQKLKI